MSPIVQLVLATINVNINLTSFTRLRHMTAAQNLAVSHDADRAPYYTVICHSRLGTINLCTEFEVSVSTNYEDIKDDAKYRKWSGLR